MSKYDLTVIGTGPCGYVASIWAARCNLKVAVVEKSLLGGTCLNWGCIPTKILLHTAKVFVTAKNASSYGVNVGPVSLDFEKAFIRKEKVLEQLRNGINSLFKARKIDLFKGEAKILDKGLVEAEKERLESENILIATGSRPLGLPIFKFDKESILTSDDIMSHRALPESILIVGGGAIGCEYATLYNSFGKKVVIVEMMDTLIPLLDSELGKRLAVIFKNRGIEVATKTKVEAIKKTGAGIKAALSNGKVYNLEKALICVGRKFNSENLGLEKLGVKFDNGKIIADEYFRTNVPGIYAAGDVIGGVLLAHVASHEGMAAVNNIKGERQVVNYNAVPNCIFTNPEIATVGLSEQEAKANAGEIKVSRFPYSALGKAQAIGEAEGFVKIIGEVSSGKILGAHILGAHATDLIGELTLALKGGLKVSDLMDTIHAHPTFSESISEAAFNFYGKAIHII